MTAVTAAVAFQMLKMRKQDTLQGESFPPVRVADGLTCVCAPSVVADGGLTGAIAVVQANTELCMLAAFIYLYVPPCVHGEAVTNIDGAFFS